MGQVIALPSRPALPQRLSGLAMRWFGQSVMEWRPATRRRIESILCVHVLDEFARHPLEGFDRSALIAYRSRLHVDAGCSLGRIFHLPGHQPISGRARTPVRRAQSCQDLRRVPVRRPAIQPFSLPQLRQMVAVAPDHLRDYIWIRGLVGLRSGEANGLRWDSVDLKRGVIEISRARSEGEDRLPKNEYSQRLIQLTPTLAEAFERQHRRTGSADGYVFLTRRGTPLSIQNFASRDWKRILVAAGLTTVRRSSCGTPPPP